MIFKNELPLDHAHSLNDYAQKTADAMCDIACEFSDFYTVTDMTESVEANWDYEYESAWNCIEHGLESEGLEWRTNDGVWT